MRSAAGERQGVALWPRYAPWLAMLWLGLVTLAYVWTAAEAVRQPFNMGWDLRWAAVWLALVLACLVSWRVVPRPLVARLWSGAAALVALALVVMSRQWLPALLTLWLLGLAVLWGGLLLRRLGLGPRLTALEFTSLAVALGLGLLACVGLVISVAHLLTPTVSLVSLMLLTLPALRPTVIHALRRAWPLPSLPPVAFETAAPLLAIGYAVVWNLVWALAPEIQFDALNYHLSVPKLYVAAQGVTDLSYFGHASHTRLIEMLFLWPLALGDATTPKLLVFALSLLVVAEVYALGRRVFGRRVGLWAAALFYTTPLVGWLATTAYNDLPALLFTLAALLAVLHWLDTRAPGWLWASGWLAGGAVGTKATAFYVIPALAVVVVWSIVTESGVALGRRLRQAAAFGVGLCLVAAPVYLMVSAFTGYSLVSLVTRGGAYSDGVFALAEPALHDLSYTEVAWWEAPFALTFRTLRFGEGAPNGALGAWLLLLPLAWGPWALRRRHTPLLLILCAVALSLWALTFGVLYARYYVAVLPLVILLAVAGALHLAASGWPRRLAWLCLGVLLVAQPLLTPVQYWNIPERSPLAVVLGQETAAHFLDRALAAYQAAQYVNQTEGPDDRVIGVGVEPMRFFLDRPLAMAWDEHAFDERVKRMSDTALAADLARSRYAYVLAAQQPLFDGIGAEFLRPTFLADFATLVYSRRGVDVYRLAAEPRRSVQAANALANPGFEAADAAGLPSGWAAAGRPVVNHDAAQAHSGQAAIQVDAQNSVMQSVPVVEGRRYVVGYYSRADTGGQTARLQVQWRDAADGFLDITVVVVAVQPWWTWSAMTVLAPPGATRAEIVAVAHDAASRVWLDDVWFGPEPYA